jgi:uncharacterized protein (DUF58 family)
MPVVIFLSIILGLLLFQAIIYKKRALSNLDVSVHFSSSIVSCGDLITITESIANRKALPLPWVLLKFEASRGLDFLDMTNTAKSDHYYREDLLSLGMWQRHDRHIRVHCARRGYFCFVRLAVSTRDLLLLTRIAANFPCESTLIVLPEIVRAPEISTLFQKFLGDSINKKSPVCDPFTFAGIREYQPWDPYRNINWKASAKNNTLMVNINDKTNRREMTILLNVMPFSLSKDYFILEKSISLVLTWITMAVHESVPVRLITNSMDILTDESITTESGCSEDHIHQIGISLARIDLTKRVDHFIPSIESVFDDDKEGMTYVVISPNTDTRLQKFLADRSSEGHAITWVLPYTSKQPPLLEQVSSFTIPLEVINEGLRK